MSYQNILEEIENEISTITIDRPKKLNALNRETILELHQAFKAAKDNDEVKVVIITGSGEKAFVAGADISEFADYSPKEGKKLSADGQEKLFDYVANFPKPVIAAVNGFALDGPTAYPPPGVIIHLIVLYLTSAGSQSASSGICLTIIAFFSPYN